MIVDVAVAILVRTNVLILCTRVQIPIYIVVIELKYNIVIKKKNKCKGWRYYCSIISSFHKNKCKGKEILLVKIKRIQEKKIAIYFLCFSPSWNLIIMNTNVPIKRTAT